MTSLAGTAPVKLCDAAYIVRMDFLDQLECPASSRNECPVCKEFDFVGGPGDGDEEGMFLLGFAAADDAVLWRMNGHIKKHQLVDVGGRGLPAIFDKLDEIAIRQKALNEELKAWTRQLNSALPDWERTTI